jgi:DNA-binding NarL/FixJ family response regulator
MTSTLGGLRTTVALREPIEVLRRAITDAFSHHGVAVADDGPADVVVWTVAGPPAHVPTGGPPVLALVEGRDELAIRALYAAGVRGVLDRGSAAEVIVTAALAVAAGLVVAEPHVLVPLPDAAPLLLDRDELRWMRALAAGTHVIAIAGAEGWSERDMYRKFKGIYAKLGVSGREEALVLLARADLLSERRG